MGREGGFLFVVDAIVRDGMVKIDRGQGVLYQRKQPLWVER